MPGFFFGTSSRLADDLAGFFSTIVERGLRESLIDKLRSFEPRLRGLELLPLQGTLALHATIEMEGIVPLSVLGDGFYRALTLFVVLLQMHGGLLLIDEIETGIYHEAMPQVWRSLMEAARDAEVPVEYDEELLDVAVGMGAEIR